MQFYNAVHQRGHQTNQSVTLKKNTLGVKKRGGQEKPLQQLRGLYKTWTLDWTGPQWTGLWTHIFSFCELQESDLLVL